MSKLSMRTRWIGLLLIGLSPCRLHAGPTTEGVVFDEVIDSPMYKLPDVPVPPEVPVFPEGARELWLRALQRPEADMKCKAAEAITDAHRRGIKGFEKSIPLLIAVLDEKDQRATVRLAVARALITLDAKEAAESLFRQAQAGSGDLRNLVEPMLAKWDYRPARTTWLERLRDPATPPQNLRLAIQSLAAVREGQAVERLRAMVLTSHTSGPIRLEAARALGSLRTEGLEKDAEQLAADPSPRGLLARLTAATLLHQHRSPDAVRLVQRLIRDTEPSVAAIAAARLIEIDPKLAVPSVEHLLKSSDPNLRSLGVEVLHRVPTREHLRLLSDQTGDVHRGVRIKARRALHELAQDKKWHDPIIQDATRMLKGKQWESLEQAAILLTQLDHKPAAGRLVELLPFEQRLEVSLAAAWGLRKLNVPETLDGVVRQIESRLEKTLISPGADQKKMFQVVASDYIVSQLNQFLGQQKYQKAEPLLRRFVPKPREPSFGPEARAAAIWALGLIHEGKLDDKLASDLEVRFNDINSIPPEDARVCWMCAVALGRMKAEKALTSLRVAFRDKEPSTDPRNNISGWAIERITEGREAMPPAKPIRKPQLEWFLVPDK